MNPIVNDLQNRTAYLFVNQFLDEFYPHHRVKYIRHDIGMISGFYEEEFI